MSPEEVKNGELKNLKILVVDDDLLVVRMLLDFLGREGHECESAANGKLGFQKVLEGHFDLIVMDIQMPEMNGIDCIGAIRQIDPQVPILAISGDAPPPALKVLLKEKENGFLKKPFTPEELTEAMQGLFLQAGEE